MQTRLNTEELLQTAITALRKAGPGLPEALDRLPAPIYVTDAEGVLTHYNGACIPFAGRTPRLGEDKWCVTWELYTEDGRRLPHDQCPMAVAIHERRAVRGGEAIALRPDGTRVLFQPSPTPLFDEHGHFLGAINLLRELTDRNRAPSLWAEAARCRRLAKSINNERALQALDALATDYEGKALAQDISRGPAAKPAHETTNAILRGFEPEFLGLFAPVSLRAGDILISAGQPIQQVFFVEGGLASVVKGEGQERAEIAMIGFEGMAGHAVLLGAEAAPYTTLMQIDGSALRISATELLLAVEARPLLGQRLLQFVDVFCNQVAETSCANALLNIERRLARWLLMATERLTSDKVHLTHEVIANALSTRRAGVTMAMHNLEGKKAIKSTRSRILVIDRAKLAGIAERGSTAAPLPNN
jgi:CRP-like cAMP-binding protein